MCTPEHTWRSVDIVILSFPCMGSGDQIQVLRLPIKHLYPESSCPPKFFLNMVFPKKVFKQIFCFIKLIRLYEILSRFINHLQN